jgi:hypothetical protein
MMGRKDLAVAGAGRLVLDETPRSTHPDLARLLLSNSPVFC